MQIVISKHEIVENNISRRDSILPGRICHDGFCGYCGCGTEETVVKRNCIIILAAVKNLEDDHSRENFIRLINTGNYSAKKYFTDQFQGKCEFNFDIGPLVTLGKPIRILRTQCERRGRPMPPRRG